MVGATWSGMYRVVSSTEVRQFSNRSVATQYLFSLWNLGIEASLEWC